MPGSSTCANFAVSLRNRSCTTSRSSERERRVHVRGVGVGLGDVLALDEHRPERAVERGVEHVRDPQARLGEDRGAPQLSRTIARTVGSDDVAVAGQLVRERAHVAGALHVVLAAQRVDADAVAADVAGGHREVGHAHHHRRALAVLGDAEAVVDRRVGAGGVQPGGGTQLVGRDAGDLLERLGAVLRPGDELGPLVVALAALGDEVAGRLEALGDHDVRQRVDDGDVGAGLRAAGGAAASTCGVRTRSMRRGSTTISFAPCAQPALHPRGEHRVAVGRVGADHDHDVGSRRPT